MSLTLVSFQTVSKGESYFEAYKKYQAWEQFIKHIKQDILSFRFEIMNQWKVKEAMQDEMAKNVKNILHMLSGKHGKTHSLESEHSISEEQGSDTQEM